MKKSIILILIGATIGFIIGRIIPPPNPYSWDELQEGMHYSEVYELVPKLKLGMRTAKGVDTCITEFGKSYWQIFVYYNNEGNVSEIKKNFIR